jgi:hypothetical protein
MALAQYSDNFWFPDGTLAANMAARVFPLGSSALATLYTDATGTTQLPNPLSTNGLGALTFYAAEGEYWIHIDTEAFRVSVGSPDFDLFETVGGTLATGTISGGRITVNGANPAAIDIAPLTGYVVDEFTSPDIPAVTRVRSEGITVALAGASLTRLVTWWLMDSTGTVIQQAARPDAVQRRTHLVLGVTGFDQNSGVIFSATTLPTDERQMGNQFADLLDFIGPFSTASGNAITPAGANLSLVKTAGDMFLRSANYFPGASLTRNPHLVSTAAQNPVTFARIRQVEDPLLPTFTTIDPNQWDNNGVLTPVTGNNATIQRVWLFGVAPVDRQISVQYGQTQHANFTAALNALGSGNFIPNPVTVQNAALIAYIIVAHNATDLSNPAQCIIKRAGLGSIP